MRLTHDGGASRLGFSVLWGPRSVTYTGEWSDGLTTPQPYPIVRVMTEHRWQARISWSQIALWRNDGSHIYRQLINWKNPFFNRARGRVR